MNRKTKEKMNTAIVIMLAMLPMSDAVAMEMTEPVDMNDSVYRYNALQSKTAFLYAAENEPLPIKETKETLVVEKDKLPDTIEKKLEDITEKQNFSMEQIDRAMNALKNANGIKTFLLGNNLKILRFQLVQIKEQITLINALVAKSNGGAEKIKMNEQIDFLKEQEARVENFITEQEKKFSLLGWFTQIF